MSSFFNAPASRIFAVVGASTDRTKYGNRVLRWYQSQDLPVIPVNPRTPQIEGLQSVKSLSDIHTTGEISVSVITPPHVSEQVMREAAKLGITRMWFQPGSEPKDWQQLAKDLGITTAIGNGPCVLVDGEELLNQAKAAKL